MGHQKREWSSKKDKTNSMPVVSMKLWAQPQSLESAGAGESFLPINGYNWQVDAAIPKVPSKGQQHGYARPPFDIFGIPLLPLFLLLPLSSIPQRASLSPRRGERHFSIFPAASFLFLKQTLLSYESIYIFVYYISQIGQRTNRYTALLPSSVLPSRWRRWNPKIGFHQLNKGGLNCVLQFLKDIKIRIQTLTLLLEEWTADWIVTTWADRWNSMIIPGNW